jgi:lysophospholipase L1-like esterase
MKPFRILLFFLSIYLLLLAISLYFPDEGINISKNLKLKFFTPQDIFKKKKVKYADISDIITTSELLTDSVISDLAELPGKEETYVYDTIRANADSLRQSIPPIEYPGGNNAVLHPVFKALKNIKKTGQLIRIMHYGDSQIEGDRMTSLIRNKLQAKFGGSGIGLVPASQLYNYKFSMIHENSDNWQRYTIYGNVDTTITHRRYGALGCFCTFAPVVKDTLAADTVSYQAWISFKESKYSYSNTKQFSQCRIFYGYNHEPFMNEIYQGEELIDAEILPASQKLNELKWLFNEPVSSLTLKFEGRSGPEIYGIALDGISGVAMDNIAMRGCSGTVFTKIDRELLKEMYGMLYVKLIILQFGGNVVPYIAENYKYYEKWFYSQIRRLYSVCPDVSIIVIGVADMSVKEKDRYVTYPNLKKVRNALKDATFRAGAAYWDMYEAMGGDNSMPSWVFAEPPLASKDFVHFNPKGARIIAQMFYNSFIYEYNRYEKTHPD